MARRRGGRRGKRGGYNLRFIDWDNEFEAVTQHMNDLALSG